jgi:hypothetical protein
VPALIAEHAKLEKREVNLNGTKILRPAPMACNCAGRNSALCKQLRSSAIARCTARPDDCSRQLRAVSPLAIAPTFRALHLKYPVEDLRRSLAEGIIANHPTMPQFRFDADQIEDLVAFLKTLER